MASTSQLQSLFEALRAGDLHAARTAAERIASEREHQGHTVAARTLRSALRADGHVLLQPSSLLDVPDALARVPLGVSVSEVELADEARATLEELLLEARHGERLAELGLARRTRLLISGPPGVGKSLTARALGGSLGLPVYVVRIDAVVGSLLGQTSSRLHDVFRFAERSPCVLLLDEFDALGRQRGERLDIAELDRVVVGLMQELDYAHVPGLLVATTNFVDAVDPALRRRFDIELTLPLPHTQQRRAFVKRRAHELEVTSKATELMRTAGPDASYARLERVIVDAARRQALSAIEVELFARAASASDGVRPLRPSGRLAPRPSGGSKPRQ